MALSLFVYGSLRPGQCNYDQLSDFVLEVHRVVWPGHLRLRPEGYPALVLPPEWPVVSARPYDWTVPPDPAPTRSPAGQVPGEILKLRDTPEIRRRLDDFEGFTPVVADYLRVACPWQGAWVWTYVASPDYPHWPIIERWPVDDRTLAPWR